VRHWVVGGAVIESGLVDPGDPGRVLLVENLRGNGTSDWTPPGGVIDHGEGLVAGLRREVLEETGLEVTGWNGPLYEIEAEAPGLEWNLRVEVHRAVDLRGRLTVGADPDGIVVGAEWVDPVDCESRLGDAHPWVREPLLEWLRDRWTGSRIFRYQIEGDRLGELSIVRR
jgi:8-oxo-dGTP diphosphatase